MKLTDPTEIEREAKRLYDECQTCKPDWENLGDVTKSVWREYAQGRPRSIRAPWPPAEEAPAPAASLPAQESLF